MLIASNRQRELYSVGVDYITATARDASKRRYLERVGQRLLRDELSAGNEQSPFRLYDLEGLRCGSVEYAQSYHFDMIRLSSRFASDHWTTVVQHADNVSRIDLEVTVRLTPRHDNFAEAVERSLKRFKREHNTRLEIELRRNDVKGKTLYSGSRKSDRFARLYDKGKETRLPELDGCWRLEQQIQNALALRYAQALAAVDRPADCIYSEVARYYRERGAALITPGLIVPLELNGTRTSSNVNPSRRREWLRKQVRPYVERERDNGRLNEVLADLGLSDLIGPTGP